jgi:hypothetical protein
MNMENEKKEASRRDRHLPIQMTKDVPRETKRIDRSPEVVGQIAERRFPEVHHPAVNVSNAARSDHPVDHVRDDHAGRWNDRASDVISSTPAGQHEPVLMARPRFPAETLISATGTTHHLPSVSGNRVDGTRRGHRRQAKKNNLAMGKPHVLGQIVPESPRKLATNQKRRRKEKREEKKKGYSPV